MKTKSLNRLFAALVVTALSTVSSQAAGTDTWVGNTDANWNTAANWTTSGGSTPPASGDSLVFGAAGSAGLTLNNNISGLTLYKLTFNSGASSFTIGGNGFALGVGGIDASALTGGTETITNVTTIGNGLQRWNVGAGATLAFGSLGAGADAADLYTPNGAMAIISKTGTIMTTTADGWGWRSGAVAGTGLLGPGMVIDNGDNTYDWASVGTQTAGTSHAIVAATYTTVPGGTSDAHNVKVTSNSSYSGGNASWASILVSNATLTVSPSLYVDTGLILEKGGTVAGGGSLRANADGLYTYVPDNGTISIGVQGAKKLYKAGPGTLTLSGANGYAGDTLLYGGTVALGSTTAIGNGTLTLNGGNLNSTVANLVNANNNAQNWNADFTFVGSQSLNLGFGTVTMSASRQVTVSSNTLTVGYITDGGMGYSLTKTGNGALKLGGGYGHTGATVVKAGTLILDAAQSSSSSSALTVSNAALTVLLNDGNSSIYAAGVSFAGTNVLNFNFGTATTPWARAIDISGYSVANTGTNIINVTGPNLIVGQYPLIYTGGSVPTNNFVLGSVSPGVSAVLTNSGTSLDLLVTSTGQMLTWYGADSVGNPLATWNINTSSNWNSGNAKYLQYAGNSYGDYVTFDDSVYSPANADITLNTTVVPANVTFNNYGTPYSITGSGGIGGAGSLVKSGSASLYLGTANSYTGGTVVNSGTLIVTNDSALGASSGSVTLSAATLQFSNTTASVRGITVTANSTIDVVTNANAQLAGDISGTAGLTKTGNGTLTLSGINTYAGKTVVDGGTLGVTGGQVVSPALGGPGLVVANTQNASLNVSGGTVTGNTSDGEFGSGLIVGNTYGIAGCVFVSGSGKVTSGRQLVLGNASGSYGAWSQTGGTNGTGTSTGGFLVVGAGGAGGVFEQSGGAFTIGYNAGTIAAGNSSSLGVMNLSGGTFNSLATSGSYSTAGGLAVGEFGIGVLNVSGSALVNLGGNFNLNLGRTGAGSSGTVNLLGGTLATTTVTKGAGTGMFNFNGGTLKARAASGTFMNGLTRATVYGVGAVVDDGGFAITIAQPLLAPDGYGVSSITLSDGGSGYIAPPVVTISGGTGSNATAIAQISGGAVTTIVVTSPGTGYDSSDILSVTFTGGGGSGATANTPALVANTSGGLTKNGNGTLLLNAVNTYTGSTWINAGTLAGTGTIAGTLTNNAALAPGAGGAGALTVNGNIILNAGSTNIFTANGTASANTSVIAGGNVTYGGVLKIATNGTFTAGQQFQLFSGAGVTNASSFASILGSPGSGLAFSFTNGVLSVVNGGPSGPSVITNSISGNTLTLNWPAGQGWKLQMQTNNLATGLGTNWVYVTDGTSSSTNITLDPTKPTVFYRLVYP